MWNALLHEFGQLHESTVESDGYGAESANQTRGRFERLHASMSTGSGKEKFVCAGPLIQSSSTKCRDT